MNDPIKKPAAEQAASVIGRPAAVAWVLTITVLVILLAAPETRWIVLRQASDLFQGPHELSLIQYEVGLQTSDAEKPSTQDGHHAASLAAANPGNFQIQVGYALLASSYTDRLAHLQALTGRFKDQPALCALIMNAAMHEPLLLQRPDSEPTLNGVPPPRPGEPDYIKPYPPPTPVEWSDFVAAADNGTRLEPKNAFFPWVRACGLLSIKRDAEAVKCIQEAATKPYFNDYAETAVLSLYSCKSQLTPGDASYEALGAEQSYIPGELLSFNAGAMILACDAIADEQSGHILDGIKLRMAMLRCAELLRVDGSSAFSAGNAFRIGQIATTRLGGRKGIRKPKSMSWLQWYHIRRDRAYSYLESHGYAREAGWCGAELDAELAAAELVQDGWTEAVQYKQPFMDLADLRLAGMVVLVDLAWFVFAGFIASPISRMSSGINARRRWACAGMLILGLVLLGAMVFNCSAWAKSLTVLWTGAADISQSLLGESIYGRQSLARFPMSDGQIYFLVLIPWLTAPVLPFFYTIATSVVAAVSRQAFAKAIAISASWVALLLILLYAALISVVAQQESTVTTMMKTFVHSEGQYMATQLGRRWPGVTAESSLITTLPAH